MLTLISDLLNAAKVDLWAPELLLEQSIIPAESLLVLVKAALTVRFAAIEILKGAVQLEPMSITLGIPDYIARVIRNEGAIEVVGQEEGSMLDIAKQICEQWQLRDLDRISSTEEERWHGSPTAAPDTAEAQLGVKQASGLVGKLEALTLERGDTDRAVKSAAKDDTPPIAATPASMLDQTGVQAAVNLSKEQLKAIGSDETRSKSDMIVEDMADQADLFMVSPAIYELIQPRTVSMAPPDAPMPTTTMVATETPGIAGHAPLALAAPNNPLFEFAAANLELLPIYAEFLDFLPVMDADAIPDLVDVPEGEL
ncbi:hypothetical protein GGF31_006616 [Allomyces arbusculus]|nr:hypothetical protein GGF31_006616 [Allomyces arbusculus]